MLHFFVPLDRQLILTHAFTLLNEMGLEGLTLRRLAGRLGVQAPALYWHFKNKQELLDEMATRVFREALEEAPVFEASQSWQNWALSYCLGLRRVLLRYREGARMFSGTYLTDAALYAPMDASLRKLTGAGFNLRQAVVALRALYCYVVGFVIEEQALDPAAGQTSSQYDLTKRNARIDPEKYPLAHAAGVEMFEDHDRGFIEGAGLIVSGMTLLLPSNPGTGLTNPA